MTDRVPSLVQRDLLQGLIEQWRELAKVEHERGNNLDHARDSQSYCYGTEHALDRCAAELEAVAARLVVGEANCQCEYGPSGAHRGGCPAVTRDRE